MSDVVYDVAIVGGGLAGLGAAISCARTGAKTLLLESTDELGGKLRTDLDSDGFCYDRGFQVYFSAYDELGKVAPELKFPFANCFHFGSGAAIVGRGMVSKSDPIRSLLSSAMTPNDLLKLLSLNKTSRSWEGFRASCSVLDFLRDFGFSERAIECFFVPFYGGIALDRKLAGSARQFLKTWFYLSIGSTITFRKGIAELPRALGEHLASFRRTNDVEIRLNEPVTGLLRVENAYSISARHNFSAKSVILAAGAKLVERALGISCEIEYKQSICLYFASNEPKSRSRLIVLNPDPGALVNQLAPMSAVNHNCAPLLKQLYSATIIGERPESDEELAQMAIKEMNTWGMNLPLLEFKRAYRIKEAQLRQEPGFEDRVPSILTHLPGVFLAGEMTTSSSINDALKSGRLAAEAALAYLKNK